MASYVCEHGPFDCVLGFSLGASLVTTLLMCPDKGETIQKAKKMIQAAVFICGILPQKWESLQRGQLEEIRPGDVTEEMKIDIKTVHAYCLEDDQFQYQGQDLLRLCKESMTTAVLHTAGHSVPKSSDEVAMLARAIAAQCGVLHG